MLADHLTTVIKDVFRDSKIAENLTLGHMKCTNIVKNVISQHETNCLVEALKIVKFSVLVDETTDIAMKKLLCVLVRYVCPIKKTIQVNLLKLIEVNAADTKAETLYFEFKNCLEKYNIPIKNIIGLASDGANVMIGEQNSFYSRLRDDTAIIASKACAALPKSTENLLR